MVRAILIARQMFRLAYWDISRWFDAREERDQMGIDRALSVQKVSRCWQVAIFGLETWNGGGVSRRIIAYVQSEIDLVCVYPPLKLRSLPIVAAFSKNPAELQVGHTSSNVQEKNGAIQDVQDTASVSDHLPAVGGASLRGTFLIDNLIPHE
jgi:hypothetical protein